MFCSNIARIKELHEKYPDRITELNNLFSGRVNVYVDYANVRPWAQRLDWNIDIKRLKQFLYSFDNVSSIKFYNGTLLGDTKSEVFAKEARKVFKDGYRTKSVKIMKHSVDYSSIKPTETSLLEQFIRKCLLLNYELRTIEYLNEKFKEMNARGTLYIEDRKCNFDVEIGRDMLLDYERGLADTFVLWSGDSDFYEPISQLLKDKKNVLLFATSRRVSSELNSLQKDGLFIYDIQKIRNFICYREQIQDIAKGTPCGAPKL